MKRKNKGNAGKSLGDILVFVSMSLVGAVCGIAVGRSFGYIGGVTGFAPRLFALGGALLYLCLAFLLHLVFHELGHLFCGLLSGYHFTSFRIGSFMLLKKDDDIRLKRYSLMGTGGQCLMAPPDMRNGRIPYVLYNMGGSLMNLLVAGVFGGLYGLFKNAFALSPLFLVMAVAGGSLALVNGIPLRLGAVNNDGSNALSLGKDESAMWGFWLQLKMNSLITQGVRPKDMPDAWFTVPTGEALKNSIGATIGVFACNRAMDQKRFDLAEQIARELLEKSTGLVGVHKGMLTAEIIFCELIGENRQAVLEPLFTKETKRFLKAMAANPSIIRLQYAYALLASHDMAAAEKERERFEKIAQSYPYSGEIEGERELMAYTESVYARL